MTKKIIVEEEQSGDPLKYVKALEAGDILFFSSIPFSFPEDEIEFLLSQKQKGSRGRKNIAYKPKMDVITNHEAKNIEEAERMKEVLRNYSQRATSFLTKILPSYVNDWQIDYTSFRPFQEQGRKLRTRARNDLLHVDSFPTRPLNGNRILRFFTNINPTENRSWMTSVSFSELMEKYGKHISFSDAFCKLKKFFGISIRSPYDTFMLRLHNFLKENQEFQGNCPKDFWEFPPRSCWAVYTDIVSHAALAGQYALEQTFLIPVQTLLFPEKSPIRLLEGFMERDMLSM